MKRLVRNVLAALGLSSRSSKADIATPSEFTREFAESLRQASPGLKVAIVQNLELKVTSAEGKNSTTFLGNAYNVYKQAPAAKADVIHRFVRSSVEAVQDLRDEIDRSRIVPVIKDRAWLDEMRQLLLSRGEKEAPEHVFDEFCSDLVVVYAEDSPKNIRYLAADDLEEARVSRSELRTLACENLKRLLPEIQRHGADGLYMITAGGDYEASLLLLDSIWSSGQMDVQGEIVVAIPARDLLLVTGSQSPEGIEKVKQMVQKASSEGSYRLTTKLLVYRNGKFEEYCESAEPSGRPKPR